MLPPFSKVSGSAPFSKGHVSFLAPFFKGFWKCSLFQGSCQLLGTLFQRFLKGHVSFLAPFFPRFLEVLPSPKVMSAFWHLFFQRFLEALPFPRAMSTFCTFLERFLDVLPFPRVMSILPEVDSDKSPLLQRFASTWFCKIPLSKVLFQSVPLFQRFLEVLLIPHGPFSKG